MQKAYAQRRLSMNFTVWHNEAPSGARINSVVVLLIPEDDETFSALPWRAETTVDACRMATSHHKTRAAASASAEGMHEAYLAVHADYPEYRALKRAAEARA
jgi:hypothetical protein